MGYRLRPSWVWQRKRFGTSELVVAISNRGVAGVPGVLWLTAKSPDGSIKLRGSFDPGHPYGGALRMGSFLLPKNYIGTIDLLAEIEMRPDVHKPVAWACEQPCNPDGSLSLQIRPINDPKWRKAI
jgi:hypothetical protein